MLWGSEVTLGVTFRGTDDCRPEPCGFVDIIRAKNKGLLNPALLGIGPEKASLFIFLKSEVV
jgi:hypothetical protein